MSILDRPFSRRQMLRASAAVPAAMLLSKAASAGAVERIGNTSRALKGADTTTMTMSDWWGSQFGHYFPQMQKLTNVTIDQQLYPYSTTKLFTQLDAGSAADIFLVDSHWNGTLLPEANKVLVPFDAALKSAKVDMSKWNISPTLDNGYDGHIWGLDLFVTQDVIGYVNTELAEKDGLLKDLPLWGTKIFDTWKWPQFVDWLKAGTKITASGKVEQYGYSASAGYLFQPILASMGGALMNNQFTYDETKSLFDSPEVIETVQMIANLYTKDKVAAPLGVETSLGGPNASGAAFLAKKALATQGWSTPSVYPVQTNFPMSYIHLPYVDKKVHAVGSNSLCVNKMFSDPQTALDWIITFTTNTAVRKNFIVWSSVPAYDPLPIVNTTHGDPKTIALINLSRIKGQSPLPADTVGINRWPYWLGRYAPVNFQNAIMSVPQEVILGKATAKQACQAAAKQLNAAITQGRQAAGK
jgi:maltose-binding protein MalE